MAANAPEVVTISDSDYQVTQKVVLYFDTTTTSNARILQANTVRGANTSRICQLDIEKVQYNSSLASGYVALEYIGSANSRAYTIGGRSGGVLEGYVPNNATGPTGDIGLGIIGAAAGDSVSLLITYRKNNANGAFDNVASWF